MDSLYDKHSIHRLRKQRDHRRGIRLNLLLIGENGIGLSSFVATVCGHEYRALSLAIVPDDDDFELVCSSAEISEPESVPLKLHIVSTVNYGHQLQCDHIPDKIAAYLEQQYKDVLDEELKIHRNPRFEDTRVHAALMFIRPTARGLSALDIATMKRIQGLVNLIPVLAKADTLTLAEIALNKRLIQKDLKLHEILCYLFVGGVKDEIPLIQALLEGGVRDDDEDKAYVAMLQNLVPFTIINRCKTSCAPFLEATRNTRWGTVPISDDNVCDMNKLRNCLFTSHLRELKDYTVHGLYETYRENRLVEHVPNGGTLTTLYDTTTTSNGSTSRSQRVANGAFLR